MMPLGELHVGADRISAVVGPDTITPENLGEYRMSRRGERVIAMAGWNSPSDASVFLHELLHGIANILGLDLSEQEIRGLEMGLAQALRSNPGLSREVIELLLGPYPPADLNDLADFTHLLPAA